MADNTSEEIEKINNTITHIKMKMRKARAFYKKGKMEKKRYQTIIRKYKKKLNDCRSKKEMLGSDEGTSEIISDKKERTEEVCRPSYEQRCQLNFEDVYVDIEEDESWVEPLLNTEFECETKECLQCQERVRMHWLVCPSCKSDLQ